jgi:hypothetical protein
MKPLLVDTLPQTKGVLLTRDLIAAGFRKAEVLDWMRAGAIIRVRRGAFVPEHLWNSSSEEARHRLLVQATALLHPSPLLFSHYAAAALHRMPLVGPWPHRVHVLEPMASGGSSMPSLFVHRTTISRSDEVIDGLMVTGVERTLVDVACSDGFLQSVAMIDYAIHKGRATCDSLLEELAYVAPGRGAKKAARAIYFADGRAESVGESLSRVRMHELGFQLPELQTEFRGPGGARAFVDFSWRRGRLIGEFDGREKYVNPELTRGRSTQSILLAEKDREDWIRPQVDGFFRWGWGLAWDQRGFGAFLQAHGVPRRDSATF